MTTLAPKPKFPRAQALAVAKEVCDALKPATERLIVAGSLRRRKERVGDVEILYIPKFAQRNRNDDLFAPPYRANLADEILDGLIQAGIVRARESASGTTSWGDKNKLAVHIASGIPVDLFATAESSWFNYLVCRTGSAESNTRIASAALKKHWHWHPYSKGFTDHLGNTVTVETEQDVFRHAGLPYLEPWQR